MGGLNASLTIDLPFNWANIAAISHLLALFAREVSA